MTIEVKEAEAVKVDEVIAQPAPPPQLPAKRSDVHAGAQIMAIVPSTYDEAFKIARAMYFASMVPESYLAYKTPRKEIDNIDADSTIAKVCIGILKGLEVGFPPVTAISTIYVVNNRPTIYGDGALALVQSRPDYVGHREWSDGTPGHDDYIAHCEIKRRGHDGSIIPTLRAFSWKDAVRAGLASKAIWRQYPQRMTAMRARAWCIRDSFSDALAGLSITEEVQDIPTKPDVVPTSFLDAGVDNIPTQGAIEHGSADNSGQSAGVSVQVADADPGTGSGDAGPDDRSSGGNGGGYSAEVDIKPGETKVVTIKADRAPDEDEAAVENTLIKKLLNCEAADDIDALVAAYALALDRWRLDETYRYTRVSEQIKGKREALSKRRRK